MKQYCAGGINAVVDPAFHKMKAKLDHIKSLNDAYDGKQLTFFSLEDCSELSSSLLEAIVQMHSASTLVETEDLKIGTTISHPMKGLGQIVQILPDTRRVVRFRENEEESYAPQLIHKMIVETSDRLRSGSLRSKSPVLENIVRSKQNNAYARTLELTVVSCLQFLGFVTL